MSTVHKGNGMHVTVFIKEILTCSCIMYTALKLHLLEKCMNNMKKYNKRKHYKSIKASQ